MVPIEEFRKKLLAQRREVLRRVGRLEDDLDPLQESVGVEMEERAQADLLGHVLLGLDERSREELIEISRAPQRIASGDYGRCEVCGESIPLARL